MNDAATTDIRRYVGHSIPRVETVEKVNGQWIYGTDFTLPGMLYAKALRSPYAHARILAIDTSRARQLPGVRVVVTGDDAPYLFGSAVRDEPFIARGKVRYAGEPVAAVAAISEEIAREAIDLIEVEYEELEGLFDPLAAMQPDAPLVHDDIADYHLEPVFTRYPSSNIINHTKIRRGDIEQGFAESDEIYEDVFTTQYIQHAPLETHVGIAQVAADGKVTLWSNSQAPYNFVRDMAGALDLPYTQVRVICTGIGGGFGSKLYLRPEPVAVALALHTDGKPVKHAFTRVEEFTACVAKHPVHLTFKTGVKRDGTFVARKITAVFNTGAYADTGPLVSRNGSFSGTGPYRFDHVWVDSYCVYTNSPLGGAFRGYGVPQLTWAHESQMDMIARRLGMDPAELRRKNLFELGDTTCTGEVLRTSVGVKETLAKATEAAGYGEPLAAASGPHLVRGRGIATMHKLTYTPTHSTAIVKMQQDGSVNLLCSSLEIGQGLYTVLRQIIGEKLGIPYEYISIGPPDTEYTPYDQSTSGSRSVFHMGNAVVIACDDLTRQVCELAAPMLARPVEDLEFRDGAVWVKGSNEFLDSPEIIRRKFGPRGSSIQGHGTFIPPKAQAPDMETGQSPKVSAFWMYATQVADVEVDTETGQVKLLRIVAAHDLGKAINPADSEAQIEGGVAQGIGATLQEEMIVQDGVVTNPTFAEYKIPTTQDVPEIVPILVEAEHDEGPYGAKGLGEPVLAPTSPAIANAIYDATGARVTSLPITPEKVLAALEEARRGGEAEK